MKESDTTSHVYVVWQEDAISMSAVRLATLPYQDNAVRFKLIQGLTDQEIKEHVLSEEDKSLEDTVKAIEAKKNGKIARKAVGVTTSPVKVSLVGDSNPHKRCSCCGRPQVR